MWSRPGVGRLRVEGLRYAYPPPGRPAARLASLLFGRPARPEAGIPWVLDGLSFEVGPGETLGVLGANGTGKSTLLQILAGLAEPSGGSVEVAGRTFALLEPGAGLDPDLTGRENLVLRAAMMGAGRAEAERMVPAMAEFSGVGFALDRPLRTYSTGMQLRLGFSLLAALAPDVVLIDEALAVGDLFFQQKCMRLLGQDLGAAAKVLVSHDVHALLALSTRILVLDGGKAAWLGPPGLALDAYRRLGPAAPAPPAPVAPAGLPPGWMVPGSEARSGPGELEIRALCVSRAEGGTAETVRPGDAIVIELRVRAARASPAPVLGWFVSDRLGLPIFGSSSLVAGRALSPLPPGDHRIRMAFTWPRAAAGEYALTVGLGEGLDAGAASPQSWASGIHVFRAIMEAGSGCLFEQPFTELTVQLAASVGGVG